MSHKKSRDKTGKEEYSTDTDDSADSDTSRSEESDEDSATCRSVDGLTKRVEKLDVSDKQTILDTMWNTVLNHGYGYSDLGGSLASDTYLVCKIDTVPKPIIQKNDEGGKHAEEKLMDKLEKSTTATEQFTVYINNSPCAACAGILETYLEKNKGIHLTLYVTHLYNIKRKSCQDRAEKENEGHLKYIGNNDHAANYQGLRDLMKMGDNRCKIEAFTEDVWRELHEVMGLTEDCKQRMKKYDNKITDPKNKKKSHDRSRKSEDSNIKSDLEHIEANDPWHGIPRKK